MSKIVTAIRHAKSSWADPTLSDRKRPLNGRGKIAAPAIGQYLMKLDHKPDLIISSPAKRAYKTAVLVARELGYPAEEIKIDDRLYLEGTEAVNQVLKEVDDSLGSVFFVSHEPIISEFCDMQCGLNALKYPTAGVCAMSFDIKSWSKFGKQSGEKLFFVIPKAIDPTL
jgi:phosphohistidine phosphatase